MNDRALTIFDHENFGQVRIHQDEHEKLWFCAVDVCRALELANPHQAIASLDDDEKATLHIGDGAKEEARNRQPTRYISEPGVYALVFRSNKPAAIEFQKWVAGEVLPSIRKHGAYLTQAKVEEILNDPDTIIRLAMELKAERQKKLLNDPKATELPCDNIIDMEEPKKLFW